jgi:hypothetical protein
LEFTDCSTAHSNSTLIAKKLYSIIDEPGTVHTMFKSIIDHHFPIKQKVSFEGELVARSFIKDGELQIQWANDTTTWLPIGHLKNSNPIEVAEYIVANQNADEPKF